MKAFRAKAPCHEDFTPKAKLQESSQLFLSALYNSIAFALSSPGWPQSSVRPQARGLRPVPAGFWPSTPIGNVQGRSKRLLAIHESLCVSSGERFCYYLLSRPSYPGRCYILFFALIKGLVCPDEEIVLQSNFRLSVTFTASVGPATPPQMANIGDKNRAVLLFLSWSFCKVPQTQNFYFDNSPPSASTFKRVTTPLLI